MRTIRFLAALLLVITGVMHIVLYFKAPNDPGALGMMAFGIIYGVSGLLLFTTKVYAVILGLVFPIIGMTAAIVKFGLKDLSYTMALLYLIDVIVITCCAYLLINRKKNS